MNDQSYPIVLLIGGHSGIGKSLVARQLANRWQIPIAQADDVRMVLQRMMPADEQPVLHYFQTPNLIRHASMPEMVEKLIGIAQIVSYALEAVIAHAIVRQRPIILEGDGITPELATYPQFDGIAAKAGQVRAIFLVEDDFEALLSNQLVREEVGEIAPNILDEYRRWTELSWRYGQWLKVEAQNRGLPVLPPRPWESLAERMAQISVGREIRGRLHEDP